MLSSIPGLPKGHLHNACLPTKLATNSWRRSTRPRAASSARRARKLPRPRGVRSQRENQRRRLLGGIRHRQLAGLAPIIPIASAGRPKWFFEKTVHEGCDRGAYYETGDFTTAYGSPEIHHVARLLGACRPMQRPDGWHRPMPECRRQPGFKHLGPARCPKDLAALGELSQGCLQPFDIGRCKRQRVIAPRGILGSEIAGIHRSRRTR